MVDAEKPDMMVGLSQVKAKKGNAQDEAPKTKPGIAGI